MFKRSQDPLSGRPASVEWRDKNDKPRFVIKPSVLTPLRCKVVDGFKALIGVVLFVSCVLAILGLPELFVEPVAMNVGASVIAYLGFGWLFKMFLMSDSKIEMTIDEIKVWRWYGWQCFNRNIEHQFALLNHDKMRDEQLKHDLAHRKSAAKGNILQKKVYYGDSFHVLLSYAGHRRDLLTVYGQKEAVAIVKRLQHCDSRLNEAAKMNGGTSHTPDGEWGVPPGGL